MNIKELDNEFTGTGEVKGFKFKKIESNEMGYLFEVIGNGCKHFEVIKRIVSAKCIDFEKRIYSETDFIESYPKANRFGIDGWTFYTKEKALKKLMSL